MERTFIRRDDINQLCDRDPQALQKLASAKGVTPQAFLALVGRGLVGRDWCDRILPAGDAVEQKVLITCKEAGR
jgi:hypothetical protein